MGQVYRARDTKLDRNVAFKVLPQAFADDPNRLARFEREAKVLASLNHTNIGHIYGLEEAESHKALVLVLVEGQTLAEPLGGIFRGTSRSSLLSRPRCTSPMPPSPILAVHGVGAELIRPVTRIIAVTFVSQP